MRAFVFDTYKRPVHEAEVPEPTVGDRDLLVRVVAAGTNQLDEKVRAGEFKAILPYKTPLILGHDVAGVIIRTGPGVRDFKPGDQVFARPRDGRIGTFAERIAIDESDAALMEAGGSQKCSRPNCCSARKPPEDSSPAWTATTAGSSRSHIAAGPGPETRGITRTSFPCGGLPSTRPRSGSIGRR